MYTIERPVGRGILAGARRDIAFARLTRLHSINYCLIHFWDLFTPIVSAAMRILMPVKHLLCDQSKNGNRCRKQVTESQQNHHVAATDRD
ncbi:MAG TPA: hypothetical protein VNI81_02100 [Candidatus Limnocylindrales bacterium]|nr:hypothetical protein [Candidatus Limnocylindrales bacterium]